MKDLFTARSKPCAGILAGTPLDLLTVLEPVKLILSESVEIHILDFVFIDGFHKTGYF